MLTDDQALRHAVTFLMEAAQATGNEVLMEAAVRLDSLRARLWVPSGTSDAELWGIGS